ncbi:hypothetical protein [uncultured Brevundimonas sp.]|uniref:hypothetical protein n=1 Tax=uncultured Brevundimonas sp. TaxID=213418 RepID=UPI00259AB533|nr:hypothetical protein [uncultured Brevundimonas sp.]
MPKLRLLLDLTGWAVLAIGFAAFFAAVVYTIYALTDPKASYGAHIPILAVIFLGTGVICGGALRLFAQVDRRLERIEAALAVSTRKT